MFQVIFKSMLSTSIRDKITLFYSLAFPLMLMIGLGYYFNEDYQQLNIVTGIAAISTIFWGMQGIAFQVYVQRNKGVYKLLKLTPMPLFSFISIMVLARTFIGVIINVIVWLVGVFAFSIDVTFSAFLNTFLLMIAGTLCFTSIGFVISNLARNEAQINMFSNLIQLPMIFMSEAFYSLKNVPEWVVFIGKMLPFEHYVKALRGLILESHNTLLSGYSTLIIYLVLALCLSIITFKWDNDQERKKLKRSRLAS